MKNKNPFEFSDSNKRYHTYDYFLKHKFGCKVCKVPIDGGMTCPNIDGTCGIGGCIYCSGRGGGDFAPDALLSIPEQYAQSRLIYERKWQGCKCIPYFQAHTNTYAPVSRLRELFTEAIGLPDAVGLSIATRADCLSDDVVSLLRELDGKTFLTVELGLQTVHDKTARLINRGHDYETFLQGYEKLKGLNVCVHIINGLPGETHEMMLETAARVAGLSPQSVKIHMLYVIRGTPLARMYADGKLGLLTCGEYVSIVCDQLELLPPETVIGRVTGDGSPDSLVAPLWTQKKVVVMNNIDKELTKRDSFQGKFVHIN